MSDRAPEAIVTDTAFRNQAVDVRIPLEITPKGMEDHDKAGSEIFRCIHFEEHTRNNTGDRMKETVKKRTVEEKKVTKVLVNGKDAMTVMDSDHFKDIEVARCILYLLPQEGQKRLWQRKGTNLSFPQLGQPYMAPPKDGSPQESNLSMFSISENLG